MQVDQSVKSAYYLSLPCCSDGDWSWWTVIVSPCQKRMGLSTGQICWYPQCLLRMSAGFMSHAMW